METGAGSARRILRVTVIRRGRGALVRLVRRRVRAIVVGLALAAPAAWLELNGRSDAWWVDGLSLILGATGVALIWTGLVGPKPDWVRPDHHSES